MTWIVEDTSENPTPPDWIIERLEQLRARLTECDPHFAELKPGEFLDPSPFYAAAQAGKHDEAVAMVARKYGIDPARVKLTWVNDVKDPRTPAHIQPAALGPIEIPLLGGHRKRPGSFGMLIAHELGHAYLADHGIPSGGGWEEEATTDLVTFVKGLGKLTVNGVEYAGRNQKAGVRGYGYLAREALIFAYATAAGQCELSAEATRAGLTPAAQDYLGTLQGTASGGCLGLLLAMVTSLLSVC
jgi:hypothetical protein